MADSDSAEVYLGHCQTYLIFAKKFIVDAWH